MKEFKYNVDLLINSVKLRPCLWNKKIDVYKDKGERRKAWEEIFYILEPHYEIMSLEEQQRTSEHIMNKWTNIRDTFVKSLKHTGKQRRQYILYSQLKFLVENIRPDLMPAENHSEQVTTQVQSSSQDEELDLDRRLSRPYLTQITYEEPDRQSATKKRPNRYEGRYAYSPDRSSPCNIPAQRNRKRPKKKIAQVEDKSKDNVFVEVNESPKRDDSLEPRLMNEDEAFFASLLPTVVRYDENERLEFRIEVLKIIKKIKDQNIRKERFN
ncbi:hypothetical protein ACJJTC_007490 [Scirpophaga incertulas]